MISKAAATHLQEKLGFGGMDLEYSCERSSKWCVDISFFKGMCVYAKVRVNAKTREIKNLLK